MHTDIKKLRSRTLPIPVSEAEHAAIAAAAQRQHLPAATWLRSLALRTAESTLAPSMEGVR